MGHLTESFTVGNMGSSSLSPSPLTCVPSIGVSGVVGVPIGIFLNLGDILIGCFDCVVMGVFSSGGPGLFPGKDLIAILGSFSLAGVFDPKPDFGGGFGFFCPSCSSFFFFPA